MQKTSPHFNVLLPSSIIVTNQSNHTEFLEREKRKFRVRKFIMEVAAGLKKEKMVFDETELRLGLPGNIGAGKTTEVVRKRSFSETETESDQTTTVDLKLNLSSKDGAADSLEKTKEKTLLLSDSGTKPPAK
jgi:hypothetical protein